MSNSKLLKLPRCIGLLGIYIVAQFEQVIFNLFGNNKHDQKSSSVDFNHLGYCYFGNMLDYQAGDEAFECFESLAKKIERNEPQTKKEYLQPLFEKDDLNQYDVFNALPQELREHLTMFSRTYFGKLPPTLCYSNLWKSKYVSTSRFSGSQNWHLDHEDEFQIKLFIYLCDVDEKNGALELIDAPSSQKYLQDKDSASTEKHFESSVLDSQLLRLTGLKGDIFFIDTSRCLHRGARVKSGVRDLAVFQFLPLRLSSRMLSMPIRQLLLSIRSTTYVA